MKCQRCGTIYPGRKGRFCGACMPETATMNRWIKCSDSLPPIIHIERIASAQPKKAQPQPRPRVEYCHFYGLPPNGKSWSVYLTAMFNSGVMAGVEMRSKNPADWNGETWEGAKPKKAKGDADAKWLLNTMLPRAGSGTRQARLRAIARRLGCGK